MCLCEHSRTTFFGGKNNTHTHPHAHSIVCVCWMCVNMLEEKSMAQTKIAPLTLAHTYNIYAHSKPAALATQFAQSGLCVRECVARAWVSVCVCLGFICWGCFPR